MPKIVLTDFDSGWTQNTANQDKIKAWFREVSNWTGLSEQLTKKLGVEKFKNVVLSNPQIIFEDVRLLTRGSVKFPKVTFTVTAKDGYQLASGEGTSTTLELKIRVLYSSSDPNALLLPYQGASSSAVPNRASNPNDATTIKNVNVYLNYTRPNIELDADLPTVGNQANTTINGTSSVTGDFNTKFKKLLINNLMPREFLSTVINYVNKFDPKFRAQLVTSINGVAIASVQNDTQLRIGNLNDLLYNNKVFLQQVQDDSNAVYFAVNGVTSEGWLNTFLIRIPLTKFVRPISVLEEQSAQDQTPEASQQS
ncbi:phase-variable hemagglutinin [Mycoplasma synoviae GX11-T]|nr:phase-variable hemagglutinin [Mycoplasmopsis synoviae GX11-T]